MAKQGRMNKHHVFWPRNAYTTKVERRFRNLPCNVVWVDSYAHKLIHVFTRPPDKPNISEMSQSINHHLQKHCSCE